MIAGGTHTMYTLPTTYSMNGRPAAILLRDVDFDGRTVRIERHGFDHYGRTLAFVFVGPVNLSCAQLQAGQAIYVERWDIGGRIARCPR